GAVTFGNSSFSFLTRASGPSSSAAASARGSRSAPGQSRAPSQPATAPTARHAPPPSRRRRSTVFAMTPSWSATEGARDSTERRGGRPYHFRSAGLTPSLNLSLPNGVALNLPTRSTFDFIEILSSSPTAQ